MGKFKSIKTKLMIFIGALVFICFAGAITFISIKSSNDAKESAFETARQIAKNHGNEVRADLEVAMNTARTLSKTFEGMKNVSNTDRKAVNNILKTNLEDNKNFIATWAIWDANTFDNKDKLFVNKKSKDKTGRLIPYWCRNGNLICEDVVDINNYYSIMPKVINEEFIANPYKYKIDGKEELVTSVVVPITYKGNYVGVVGVDMVLTTIQKQLINIKPYKVGHVSLISNNGTYVSCENSDKLGMDIGNSEINNEQKIAIREGKPYENTFQDTEINKEVFHNLTPIYVGNSKTPWALGVYIPIGKIMENSREITIYSMVIATLSIILIIVLIFVILTKLLRPIKNTTEMLKDISQGEGDLTKRLQVITNDEIGEMAEYFNIFVDKIQHLISQVKETIDSLAESSGEITSALSQTNKGIDEISCSLDKVSSSTQSNAGIVEETTASIHEFSQSIEVISEQANNTFENSKSILQSASIGTENIIEIVEANNSVKESSNEILTSVLELKNSSDRVEEIVTMITTISEQTNLLALNAAIESARAGEHGKGFSVVAEEVRKLAEQSKTSALQISILLNEIKSKADATNNAVIEGQRLSEVSVEKSNVVREHFDSIFVSIKEMADKIKSISNRATEQSSIADDMTKSMNEISSVVQENATSVHGINGILEEQVTSFEEISTNMEEFNTISLKLKDMTDEFKI